MMEWTRTMLATLMLGCSIATPGASGGGASESEGSMSGGSTNSSGSPTTGPSGTTSGSGSEGGTNATSGGSGSSSTGGSADACPPAEGQVLSSKSWANPAQETIYSMAPGAPGSLLVEIQSQYDCEAQTMSSFDGTCEVALSHGAVSALLRLDSALGCAASHKFEGGNPHSVYEIVTDSHRNITLTGAMKQEFELPDDLWSPTSSVVYKGSYPYYRAFAGQYDETGKLLWSTGAPDDLNCSPEGSVLSFSLAVADERLVLLGDLQENCTLNGLMFSECQVGSSNANMFVRSHGGPNLDPAWAACGVVKDETSSIIPRAVALTADGGVVVGGHFKGTVRFAKDDTEDVATMGDRDAFLAMWDAEGHFLWHHTWGTAADEVVWSLASGPDGLIVVAGGDYSKIGETKEHHAQAFVKAFVPTAKKPEWAFERELVPVQGGRSAFTQVRVSPCGAVVVAGYGLGTTQWDTGDFLGDAPRGGEDILVARLHDGIPVWGHRFGSAEDGERATALAVDASEFIYVGASFRGEVKIDDGTVWPAPTLLDCDIADAGILRISP